ncbi:MAG: hypothetical protein HGA19_13725 [Oscillochloris sp.]|nr:hypothetical protein [Oscillochloris sp.]
MRCQDAQILLSTRRDLNRSQQVDLDAHVAHCHACATAQREEDRVTRLLITLPDPSLQVPHRVAAAIGRRSTRRLIAARARRRVALATSLGAIVVVAAILLYHVAGGSGVGLSTDPQTAGRPEMAVPATTTPTNTLFLMTNASNGNRQFVAYHLIDGSVRFSIPVGQRSVSQSESPAGIPALDVALAPDGSTLYLLEQTSEGTSLVARDVRNGAVLWRSFLDVSNALVAPVTVDDARDTCTLSVSPDGSRIFLRTMTSHAERQGVPPELGLRAYAAETGQPLGSVSPIPALSAVLPLNQQEVLAFDHRGLVTRIDLARPTAWPVLEQGIVAPVLLPDGHTVRAVTLDLRVIEIALSGEALDITNTTALPASEGFFFDQAAFAPDGAVLAVGQTARDPQSGRMHSEVRIYQAPAWRQTARRSFEAPLTGLSVGATGVMVYVALGSEERASSLSSGNGPTLSTGDTTTTNTQLLALDTVNGVTVAEQWIDTAVVGILGGR